MWSLALTLIAAASAQIPSLGWCPDYQPMPNFNMNEFLGTWYEAERYFTVSELGSRCVTIKYETTPEGRILVENEITNALTGLKRLMVGTMQLVGPEGEGRVIVKYSSVPLPYDTELSILGTDYSNYAVMWSCSGIGPVHTQNAWVLTRERLAPPSVMQSAYGVLDKFKLSRTFFLKTNQEDCNVLPSPVEKQEDKEPANTAVEPKHAGVQIESEDVDPSPKEVPLQSKEDNSEKPSNPVEVIDSIKAKGEINSSNAPISVPELIISESEQKGEALKTDDKKEEKPSEEKSH
ncbi:Apolipoprotein D [Eumeta japonica]|uniref:Apolipoprotein D n=1 Tax=Eumeta variegata TaxID=151549 RepID=A0A4C1TGJ9_EUMVA|nr:Apolipoprotein D [Eumeta japonica]